jgi:hypothetical protein
MSVEFVSELTLGALMPGIVLLIPPLLAGFDLVLTGSFGLGALLADLTLQLTAALSIQVQIGIEISNPFAAIQSQLQALIQVGASLQAALSLGLPSIAVTFSASLSANAAVSAALGLQIGGIQALIKASLALKIPLVALLASLEVGPADLFTVGFVGTDVVGDIGPGLNAAVLSPGCTLSTVAPVYGIILLTNGASVSASMGVVFGV